MSSLTIPVCLYINNFSSNWNDDLHLNLMANSCEDLTSSFQVHIILNLNKKFSLKCWLLRNFWNDIQPLFISQQTLSKRGLWREWRLTGTGGAPRSSRKGILGTRLENYLMIDRRFDRATIALVNSDTSSTRNFFWWGFLNLGSLLFTRNIILDEIENRIHNPSNLLLDSKFHRLLDIVSNLSTG